MERVKIALIGINRLSHGTHVLASLKKQSDVFDLAGYVLPEGEREKFPELMPQLAGLREMTLDEVLNDASITAVAVETEEVYLTKYATLAARAGKHIHMEKPGGTSLSEFTALTDAVKAGGKTFHLGYMYRYNPYVSELLKRVRRGDLGEIVSVEAQMNCRHTPENRQWLTQFPGGMTFFLGCHLIDLILQIQGMPERVIPLSRSTGADGVTATDFGMAVFEYKHGVSFAKTCACETGGFTRRQLVVTGTHKTVELKPFETLTEGGQFTTKTEYSDPNDWFDKGVTKDSPIHDRYDPMLASFAAMVRGEKENPWSYDYELTLYKTLLAACGKKGE